jgi:hypothetical protein
MKKKSLETNAASNNESLCDMGEAALGYARKRLYVLPPCAFSEDVYKATTDLNVIREQWEAEPGQNVGIAIAASDLVVLSVTEPQGEQSIALLEHKLGLLPQTVTGIVPTVRRWDEDTDTFTDTDAMRQLIFKGVKGLPHLINVANGICVRAGGVLTVAPSLIRGNTGYSFAPGRSFDDIAIATLSEDWVCFLQTTAAFKILGEVMLARGLADRHHLTLLLNLQETIGGA